MQLATVYQDPGLLLLATGADGERAGCVGLRAPLVQTKSDPVKITAEVRRLFVRPAFRRDRNGRQLVEALLVQARLAGVSRLVLNTLPQMQEAIGLYQSVGFVPCEPYVEEPLEGTLYFELDLETSKS